MCKWQGRAKAEEARSIACSSIAEKGSGARYTSVDFHQPGTPALYEHHQTETSENHANFQKVCCIPKAEKNHDRQSWYG
jgi:hypothetical protein